MNDFSLNLWAAVALAVVMLLLGLLVGWLFGAASARSGQLEAQRQQLDEAKAQALRMARADAEATLRPEIATANERARGLQLERDGLRTDLQLLRKQADGWRDALDTESNASAHLAERAERVPVLDDELKRLRVAHEAARDEVGALKTQIGELTISIEAERQEASKLQALQHDQANEKMALLQEAREAMGNQFKSLANDILEEKSKRFAEQNQASLGTLLDPLRTRLADFQGKVELFYDTEGKQRSALSQQVSQLMELNQVMSNEAHNLTQALKGSAKMQGNWGETILERVLEASGLRRGQQYDVQPNFTRDGDAFRPDVVIHLPGERKLVVDAKVSLLAYEESTRCDNDEQRVAAVRRHMTSLRSHIHGLSGKRYEELLGAASPDFVVMFIPIEPAFLLAVSADDKLFNEAWEKNVMLVSPSTLLFVVRMVAQLWRQDQQRENAQEIAKKGADLYDKLADFVKNLEDVGKGLKSAQGAYDEAFKRLATGRGNAIRQAEMLKELGVKTHKAFTSTTLDLAIDRSESMPELDASATQLSDSQAR